MSYIIRTRCPNGCKYKSGDTCVASECPYQTGDVKYDIRLNAEDKPTKLNAEVKQAVKDFAEKLKNKLFEFFQDNEELDGKISVGPLYVDVIGVEAKDGTIISLGLINRLLKEYENDTI